MMLTNPKLRDEEPTIQIKVILEMTLQVSSQLFLPGRRELGSLVQISVSDAKSILRKHENLFEKKKSERRLSTSYVGALRKAAGPQF